MARTRGTQGPAQRDAGVTHCKTCGKPLPAATGKGRRTEYCVGTACKEWGQALQVLYDKGEDVVSTAPGYLRKNLRAKLAGKVHAAAAYLAVNKGDGVNDER